MLGNKYTLLSSIFCLYREMQAMSDESIAHRRPTYDTCSVVDLADSSLA